VGLILLPAAHLPLGALMILLLAGYAAITAIPRRRVLEALGIPPHSIEEEVQELPASSGPTHPIPLLSLFLALSIAFIVLGSDVLVNESLILGPKLGVPSSVIGTFVLAIATSLPNTWAAISLARRGLGASAIASTFNSNSINAALGAGFPSLVLTLHAAHPAGTFDASWLLAMTAAAIALLAAGRSLRRAEALILLAMYIAFVTARLAIFGA
jgi:cation:H+ antiporter